MITRLENPLQHYAWGSKTAIPELLGVEPTDEPVAELWLGAHPRAPSSTGGLRLDHAIAEDPSLLGDRVAKDFGCLPFLMKVLAAREPLSIQCHPNRAQAAAGFAKENAADVPLDAKHRNYKDDNHKPELIVALTPFRALEGFRPEHEIVGHFEQLGLHPFLGPLRTGGFQAFFEALMTLPDKETQRLVDTAVVNARSLGGYVSSVLLELYAKYPKDAGVLAPLFLNTVSLRPGQAIYLEARRLHSYLEGVGIEIMANSDNVLRGGLTPKHVDVPELVSTLLFEPSKAEVIDPDSTDGERVYACPAREFLLSCVEVTGAWTPPARDGVEILLVTEGEVVVGGLTLARGQACFVAGDTPYDVGGTGTLFRARVP